MTGGDHTPPLSRALDRPPESIGADDLAGIQLTLGVYHHGVDEGEWDVVAAAFTADASFDLPGGRVVRGASSISEYLSQAPRRLTAPPVAHHLTNVVVLDVDGADAWVRSK